MWGTLIKQDYAEVESKLQQVLANLTDRRWRSTLWICGEEHWSNTALMSLFSWDCLQDSIQDCVLIGEYNDPVLHQASNICNSLVQLRRRQFLPALGQECDLLIYNAHQGLNPDALAAVAGCIRAGGLLILLSPSAEQWPTFKDPEYSHVAVYPQDVDSCAGHFLQRWVHQLQSSPYLLTWQQESPQQLQVSKKIDSLIVATCESGDPNSDNSPEHSITEDQAKAVAAIKKVAKGHRNRPLVITADRGRGKTSALGLAALDLLSEENPLANILVIAPRAESVKPLFTWFSKAQIAEKRSGFDYVINGGRIRYLSPDLVWDQWPSADLVMVDEAAALPVYLLERLVLRYHRICFTTTIDGYEGSGRGFAIRFQPILDKVRPQWRLLNLSEPIRWGNNDPLEQWIFDSCLLKFDPSDFTVIETLSSAAIKIEPMSQASLANDEQLLRQVMGLLSLAHYRTTPGDLRNLLDGSNIEVALARSIDENGEAKDLLGVLLLAREGTFDKDLSMQIWQGKRRPRGHLLPQTLAVNVGVKEALDLTSLRVVRIAVQPKLQGQGLGGQLLSWLDEYAQRTQVDFIGTSFSLTPDLLRFWQQHNFGLVRIGLQKEKSSGCHAALMIKPITAEGKLSVELAEQAFTKLLPHLLLRSFRPLDVELLLPILSKVQLPLPTWEQLSEYDRVLLRSFADGNKGLEVCLVPVTELIQWALQDYRWEHIAGLEKNHLCLFVAHILQGKLFTELQGEYQLTSQKHFNGVLQKATQSMLKVYSST